MANISLHSEQVALTVLGYSLAWLLFLFIRIFNYKVYTLVTQQLVLFFLLLGTAAFLEIPEVFIFLGNSFTASTPLFLALTIRLFLMRLALDMVFSVVKQTNPQMGSFKKYWVPVTLSALSAIWLFILSKEQCTSHSLLACDFGDYGLKLVFFLTNVVALIFVTGYVWEKVLLSSGLSPVTYGRLLSLTATTFSLAMFYVAKILLLTFQVSNSFSASTKIFLVEKSYNFVVFFWIMAIVMSSCLLFPPTILRVVINVVSRPVRWKRVRDLVRLIEVTRVASSAMPQSEKHLWLLSTQELDWYEYQLVTTLMDNQKIIRGWIWLNELGNHSLVITPHLKQLSKELIVINEQSRTLQELSIAYQRLSQKIFVPTR